MSESGPHHGQPVYTAGHTLAGAAAAVILLHGRGASAQSALGLASDLPGEGVAYLAPQAAGHTWYPQRFIAPLAHNEPFLSSALESVGDVLAQIEAAGLAVEQVIIGGFSQGACLAAEFVARHPGRYGGVFALSGGLIGPPGTVFTIPAPLDGMLVFIGCGDADPHIPIERIYETTAAFKSANAAVTERIYPGMGHSINADELEHVRALVRGILPAG